jgi:hypothetical protein
VLQLSDPQNHWQHFGKAGSKSTYRPTHLSPLIIVRSPGSNAHEPSIPRSIRIIPSRSHISSAPLSLVAHPSASHSKSVNTSSRVFPDSLPALLPVHDGMGSTTLGCCPAEVSTPHNDVGSNLTPLGTMNVVLAQTSSLELPTTTRCTISSLQRNKVWLTVTISECPFANGLFQARSGSVNQAEVQAQLVRQSGDRLLSRSLATGKLFDVKFLTFSTSGDTGRLLPTYASLSVLEGHVNLSSCE